MEERGGGDHISNHNNSLWHREPPGQHREVATIAPAIHPNSAGVGEFLKGGKNNKQVSFHAVSMSGIPNIQIVGGKNGKDDKHIKKPYNFKP